MTVETIALIFIAIFTVLFAIIGWFVSRTISKIEKNIGVLFDKNAQSEKTRLEDKLEFERVYINKTDCDKIEKQRIETEERIKNYRDRFTKAHEAI